MILKDDVKNNRVHVEMNGKTGILENCNSVILMGTIFNNLPKEEQYSLDQMIEWGFYKK